MCGVRVGGAHSDQCVVSVWVGLTVTSVWCPCGRGSPAEVHQVDEDDEVLGFTGMESTDGVRGDGDGGPPALFPVTAPRHRRVLTLL